MSGSAFNLRCPRCLAHFNVLSTGALASTTTLPQYQLPDPTEIITCASCRQSFKLSEALPGSHDLDVSTLLHSGKPELGFTGWLLGVVGLTSVVAAISMLVREWDGPSFLVAYGVLWILLLTAGWVAKMSWHDGSVLLGFAFIAFEAVGVVRFILGSAQGMQRWDNMGWMMLIGGIFFFISFGFKRQDRSAYGQCSSCSGGWHWAGCGSSGGGSCSSGGSSCSSGGGGCGGGGCGGCGGS